MRAVVTTLSFTLPITDTATMPSIVMLCISLNEQLRVQAITAIIVASSFAFMHILKKILGLQLLLDFQQLRALIPFMLVAIVVMADSLDITDLVFIATTAVANNFAKLLASLLADNSHNLLVAAVVATDNKHQLDYAKVKADKKDLKKQGNYQLHHSHQCYPTSITTFTRSITKDTRFGSITATKLLETTVAIAATMHIMHTNSNNNHILLAVVAIVTTHVE